MPGNKHNLNQSWTCDQIEDDLYTCSVTGNHYRDDFSTVDNQLARVRVTKTGDASRLDVNWIDVECDGDNGDDFAEACNGYTVDGLSEDIQFVPTVCREIHEVVVGEWDGENGDFKQKCYASLNGNTVTMSSLIIDGYDGQRRLLADQNIPLSLIRNNDNSSMNCSRGPITGTCHVDHPFTNITQWTSQFEPFKTGPGEAADEVVLGYNVTLRSGSASMHHQYTEH